MTNPLVRNIMMFKKLSEYPAEHIYNAIKDETPQVIAVILSRLESKKAKEILGQFTSADQQDIVYRIANVREIPQEMLTEVANTIGSKLRYLEQDDDKSIPVSGQDKMAEILKHMGSSKSKELLEQMGRKDRDLADRVGRKTFTFNDIPNVELKGLRHALMKVELETLAMALKGTDDEIKTAVWNALSENRRKMLKDEMKYLGPQRRSDVNAAQAEVMSVLRGLFEEGIIRLKSDPSDDEWV